MCGIVGYVGPRRAVPILLDGLQRLEYRGYDSAGLAICNGAETLHIRRAAGKLRNLYAALESETLEGFCGIGHTRWATHGRPTAENAHPHRDCTGGIAVVHNGIVENYLDLKKVLEREGHSIRTETDSEVIAHLIERYTQSGRELENAVQLAVQHLQGNFALAAISHRQPGKIVAARSGPPIVVGTNHQESFLASDIPPILQHTREMCFLHDGDIAVLTPGNLQIMDFAGCSVSRSFQHVSWDPLAAEKGGYKHFMLKEIFEQPRAVKDTIAGRVNCSTGRINLTETGITDDDLRRFRQIRLLACGTSWHAALTGKYMLEALAGIPVEVDYASEFRYRDPIIDPETLTVVITQSGETADTLAALREAKRKTSPCLAICNVVGSMVTREAGGTLYTHAGPEIGVASTKTFSCQLVCLLILAIHLGRIRGVLSNDSSHGLLKELIELPRKLHPVLRRSGEIQRIARKVCRTKNALFLGRGIHYPIALEGALKLKEISYLHAEGYPAGEMKHGPNALIEPGMPVVVLATCDPSRRQSTMRYDKTLANIQEAKSRGATVVAVANDGDQTVRDTTDHVFEIPWASEFLQPIIEIVPLQLLAYHIGVIRGCDVDQPRNLAKSVTVE